MKIDLCKLALSKRDMQRGLKFPNILSKELAYLCGVLAGDGHISKNYGNKCRNVVYCSGNPKDEVSYYNKIISPIFLKLFNIKLKPRKFSDGTYGIIFSSKAIIGFLTKIIKLPTGEKYNKLRIPSIFKEDKNLVLAFIKGLFDTDFGFCLCKKYRKIQYYPQLCFVSKSESFTKEVWNFLKKSGLKFNGKVYRVFNEDARAKAGFTITYRFDIYGHKGFINTLCLIKIRHPKHIKKFNEWLEINKNNKKVKILLNNIAGVGFEFVSSFGTSNDLRVSP